MQKIVALVIAGLVFISFADNVSAYNFTPADTKFSSTGGTITIVLLRGGYLQCPISIKGRTSSGGRARITSVSLNSHPRSLCNKITAAGLPWPAVATGLPGTANSLKISNVSFLSRLWSPGTCGPAVLQGEVSATGQWSNITGYAGQCTFENGEFQTTPPISTSKK
jgi:hypothetical protein